MWASRYCSHSFSFEPIERAIVGQGLDTMNTRARWVLPVAGSLSHGLAILAHSICWATNPMSGREQVRHLQVCAGAPRDASGHGQSGRTSIWPVTPPKCRAVSSHPGPSAGSSSPTAGGHAPRPPGGSLGCHCSPARRQGDEAEAVKQADERLVGLDVDHARRVLAADGGAVARLGLAPCRALVTT